MMVLVIHRTLVHPVSTAAAIMLMVAAVGMLGCAAPAKSQAERAQTPTPVTPTPVTPTPVIPSPRAAETPNRLSNTDPCAAQLHEAAGALLLYYGIKHALPESADELKQVPGFESLSLVCPVSQQPYVYDRSLTLPGFAKDARLILYDPEASHAAMRWAVSVTEPKGDAALVAKVVAVPGAQFSSKRGR